MFADPTLDDFADRLDDSIEQSLRAAGGRLVPSFGSDRG